MNYTSLSCVAMQGNTLAAQTQDDDDEDEDSLASVSLLDDSDSTEKPVEKQPKSVVSCLNVDWSHQLIS